MKPFKRVYETILVLVVVFMFLFQDTLLYFRDMWDDYKESKKNKS